ncbi:group II intron reverse transcriptase domain-containing protein [bacterium]|nr:MAG: group II intron reverse transcriptase domain-containing protein [bacterium]
MDTYFTFANLHQAYLDCKKYKNQTFYHQKFAYDLEKNLSKLELDLVNRTYRPERSIAFVVTQPKIREIFAADFRDRVIHHLLYNYLAPVFEPRFIYDSWACRPAKGTHGAMLRLQQFTRKVSQNRRSRDCYYLKMDIKSFFTSIDKHILYQLVERRVKNKEIRWLAHVNIFHDCARDIPPRIQSAPTLFDSLPLDKSLFTVEPGKGLPIGNLTSQFFANVYLHELDAFVKHHLKARYYVRYVDDFVIVHEDQTVLERYKQEITEFVWQRLRLKVHPGKVFIRPISDGIDFVGYVVRPDYILIRRRVVGEWRRRMEQAATPDQQQTIYHSYQAHARWADSHKLQRVMRKRLPDVETVYSNPPMSLNEPVRTS